MSRAAPRIGVRVPQYGGTWDEIRAVAELLELAGVDRLWVNDHFQSPGRVKSDATFEAFTTLGALAACSAAETGMGAMSVIPRSVARRAAMPSPPVR